MPTRTHPLWLLLGAVLLAFTAGQAPAAAPPAADPKPVLPDSILAQIPHDASFFAAALRNKEQLDRLRTSSAFFLLKKSPAYKIVVDLIKRQLEEYGVSPELLDRLLDDSSKKKEKDEEKSENEELLELLLASAGDEVFVYGGKGWTELAQVVRQTIGAGLSKATEKLGDSAPLTALSEGGKAASLQLQKSKESLRVPELVVGMRTKDAKKIQAHVERLEKELAPLLAFDKRFEGKLKREGGMLTLELDGSFVPWDELELGDLADKKALEEVIEHLKKATLAISFGVKGDLVLLAIGSSVKDLDRLGKGKSLAQRHELQPIAKLDAKKVTAVAYLSKDFLNATLGAPAWEAAAKSLEALVEKGVEKEETKKTIKKDLRDLSAELKKMTRGHGACSGYVVRTSDGYEAFWHDFGDHECCKGVKTSLFEHVGEEAIFAAAFGFQDPGATYALLSKYARTFHDHLEAAFLASGIDEESKTEYKKHAPGLLKALKQFDDAVAKQLTPALKGQSGVGVVVEGKWKSKQWHGKLPASKKSLPMLEPALLVGLSDRDKFVAAMKESRLGLTDLYAKTRETAGQFFALPDVKWPEPKKTSLARKGDLYAWPDLLANAKLDDQVQLTAGLGKRVAVLSLSADQAEALMTPKAREERILESERRLDGPLVAKREQLVGGMVLNFPALVDVLQAWVDAAPGLIPVNDDTARSIAKGVAKQARDVAAVLKCFRQAQAATYLDGATLTTHLRLTFEDLPESPEPPRRR